MHHTCIDAVQTLFVATTTCAESIPSLAEATIRSLSTSHVSENCSGFRSNLRGVYATRQRSVGLCIAIFIFSAHSVSGQTARNTLRIGLLNAAGSDPDALSVERGVRLGAAEAKQTANLFGQNVELYEAPVGNDPIASATRLLSSRQVQVLISSSAAGAEALSKWAEQRHILFLNTVSRAQALRAECRRYSFHIQASDSMYASAAMLARQTASNSERALNRAPALDSIALWTSTLERYGGSQINGRYRVRYRAGMDGNAWAGWAAVKIISESALRATATRPAKLLAYLENPNTTFDGHKGWPLSFRLADHQLRQPLYVVPRTGSSSARVRDVPELRGSSSGNQNAPARLNQMLDELIASDSPRCPWSTRQ